jgi:hypothetical protein
MSRPHVIRLRGPWELEPVARFVGQLDGTYRPVKEGLPRFARAKMPADWSSVFGADFLGRVRYRRAFQKPTGLESEQRVFLVVEPPRSEACVLLGGELLGFVHAGKGRGRFEITNRLQSSNKLDVIVDHPALDEMRRALGEPMVSSPGGLVGEVRLEIEESVATEDAESTEDER